MPSYPLNIDGRNHPLDVTDFALGIAEQWLESAQKGGGVEPIKDKSVQTSIEIALSELEGARRRLRELPVTIPTA